MIWSLVFFLLRTTGLASLMIIVIKERVQKKKIQWFVWFLKYYICIAVYSIEWGLNQNIWTPMCPSSNTQYLLGADGLNTQYTYLSLCLSLKIVFTWTLLWCLLYPQLQHISLLITQTHFLNLRHLKKCQIFVSFSMLF